MPTGAQDTSDVIGTLNGEPITRADLANMTPDDIANMQMTSACRQNWMQRLSAMFLPQSVEDAWALAYKAVAFLSAKAKAAVCSRRFWRCTENGWHWSFSCWSVSWP